MQKSMNHKFVNRRTGKTIYMGTEGKNVFSETSEYGEFRYMGPISKVDQENEELEAAKHAAEAKDYPEKETLMKSLPGSKKQQAIELTQEEIDAIMEERKKKLELNEEEKNHFQEDDEDEAKAKKEEAARVADLEKLASKKDENGKATSKK